VLLAIMLFSARARQQQHLEGVPHVNTRSDLH
jgi:hypothetical protein